MIKDLDKSLEVLLKSEMAQQADISFEQPKRNWRGQANKGGRALINLFLYDVRENKSLRTHQHWSQDATGRLAIQNGHKKRMPYRLDCAYLLSAWAADPQDEHELLSDCLAALLRTPVLPLKVLQGGLQQSLDVPLRLAGTDELASMTDLWSALGNEFHVAVPIIVTIPFNPWRPAEVNGEVLGARFRLYQKEGPPDPAGEYLVNTSEK